MIRKSSRNILLVATALSAVGCQSDPRAKAMNPARSAQLTNSGPAMTALMAQAREAMARERKTAEIGAEIAAAEAAVQAAPADLELRKRLAQAYFAAGRFRAASEAYRDALALAPADESLRLKRALALLAQSDQSGALAELNRIRSSWDAGLAYALAGDTKRGVELLTQAARDANATARTRQNLALAYALDGQWARARVVAAQDLDPATLELRVREWAEFASSGNPALQTAQILAVRPAAEDTGRPVSLAYSPPAPQQQLASVAAPERAAIGVPSLQAVRAQTDASPVARAALGTALIGQWVVQLGAYATAELLDANWQHISRRNAKLLRGYEAVRIEANVGEQLYHRLAVSGFGNRAAAIDLCETLQTKGRDCFVRNIGDVSPVQIARINEPARV